MVERDPKVLGDVLAYLGSIGYDHLYVSQPSSAVPRAEIKAERIVDDRPAPPTDREAPRPAVDVPVAGRPDQPAELPVRPARPQEPASAVPPQDGPGAEGGPPLPEIGPGPAPEDRARLFQELEAAAMGCRRCRLCETRQNVVFGSGLPDARLMLIGEGPGSQEDRQGLPFVGPAGALLTRIIEAIGMRRDQVYIANVVKCRPPRNRDPLPVEVGACRDFLDRQIALVQPTVIVALGRVAAQALLNTSASLGSLRGRWHQVQGVETRVTYHPAALLRHEKWKRPTWEDMKVVRDRLQSRS